MTVPAMLGLVGGVVVDRLDPRKLMLWTDVLRGTAVLLGIFALAVPHGLVWIVIALLGINSLGVAFFGPAESVMVPHMVTSDDLPAANGLYGLTNQLSSAVGAALGGAAVAAIGVRLVFGLDMASFWLSALAIWLMMRTVTRPRASQASSGEQTRFGASLREGFAAFLRISVMVRLLPLVILMNFGFVAAFTMLPHWVHHHLHANALVYGVVDASWAIGVVVGSLLSGRMGRVPMRTALALVFGFQSILLCGFGASSVIWLSVGVLFVAGISNGIGNALAFTWFQRIIPESVRGRVFGLIMTLFSLANPIGALAAGFTLHVLPAYWAWFMSGAAGLVFTVSVLRHPDAFSDPSPEILTAGVE